MEGECGQQITVELVTFSIDFNRLPKAGHGRKGLRNPEISLGPSLGPAVARVPAALTVTGSEP